MNEVVAAALMLVIAGYLAMGVFTYVLADKVERGVEAGILKALEKRDEE